jgi:hypothetical protein
VAGPPAPRYAPATRWKRSTATPSA